MSKPTVAILGASSNRAKFGNISLRAHLQQGYQVYPIHPKATTIEDLTTYAKLADVPEKRLNRISVYLPPGILISVLDELAEIDHDELWLNPGTESPEVLAKLSELGLDSIQACSIVDLGISPSEVR